MPVQRTQAGGGQVKYSKKTVDEAVQLLDVYASQVFTVYMTMSHVAWEVGTRDPARKLAFRAWCRNGNDFLFAALEAAQRLREGWRP